MSVPVLAGPRQIPDKGASPRSLREKAILATGREEGATRESETRRKKRRVPKKGTRLTTAIDETEASLRENVPAGRESVVRTPPMQALGRAEGFVSGVIQGKIPGTATVFDPSAEAGLEAIQPEKRMRRVHAG